MIEIKKLKKSLVLVFPVILFLNVYAAIPEEISVTKGNRLRFGWGLETKVPTDSVGRYDCSVRLLGVPVKTVNVSVNPKRYVIPSGEAIGVKIYTEGVLVVGMSSVKDGDGKFSEPARDAGLLIGDRIIQINGEKIVSNEEFMEKIEQCKGVARLTVVREEKEFFADIYGVYSTTSGGYKLGLWIRDSTAGIGTMTFYNPDNGTYAALGHGICDSDTKGLLVARRGSINSCRVVDVIKGKNGKPGELMGSFDSRVVGDVVANCSVGVIGRARSLPDAEPVRVASALSVREGKATVLCDVDGGGVSSYEIEITKLSVRSSESNKDFVIKVTDKSLIEKTGGIVQGMSGSPILQNGNIVGAVTHVFVNNPTKGYGIFIENMLTEVEKIK